MFVHYYFVSLTVFFWAIISTNIWSWVIYEIFLYYLFDIRNNQVVTYQSSPCVSFNTYNDNSVPNEMCSTLLKF